MIERRLDHLSALMDQMALVMPRLMRSSCDDTDITPHQGILLRALEERGPISLTELRQSFPGAQSTLSEIVGRLARLGFVHKKPLPTDRRTVMVAITARGRAMVAQQRKVMRERHRNVLEKLSSEDQDRFVKALETVAELFGRAAATVTVQNAEKDE
jgi:DNA-binding MarR family transcriptional regulator